MQPGSIRNQAIQAAQEDNAIQLECSVGKIGRVGPENPARQRRCALSQAAVRKDQHLLRRSIESGVVKNHTAISAQYCFANEGLASRVSYADLVFGNIMAALFSAAAHSLDG